MNKIIVILFLTSILGCKDTPASDNLNTKDHFVKINTNKLSPNNTEDLFVDTSRSIIGWKGTKLMRSGKHEGTVRFLNGKMSFSNQKLVSGKFVVDMKSINITDIPKSDPIPRRNITNHLNIDFETNSFPTASFIISKVVENNNGPYAVTGNMTIKGISKPITVKLKEIESGKEYFSSFTLDRFFWKVGENGSWLEKKLVDPDITLKIKIFLIDK